MFLGLGWQVEPVWVGVFPLDLDLMAGMRAHLEQVKFSASLSPLPRPGMEGSVGQGQPWSCSSAEAQCSQWGWVGLGGPGLEVCEEAVAACWSPTHPGPTLSGA